MRIELNRNGAFSIFCEKLSIKDCLPSIDGRPIRPLRFELTNNENEITYVLEQGKIHLTWDFCKNGLRLRTCFENMMPIAAFSPISYGMIEGCENQFIQGLGMGGPSNIFKLNSRNILPSSFGITAIGNIGNWMIIHVDDCRRFLFRATATFDSVFFDETNAYGSESKSVLSLDFMTEKANQPQENLPDIYFTATIDLYEGLTSCAVSIAREMCVKSVREPTFHWCSWYYEYFHFSQKMLETYIRKMRESVIPFQYIQIDAGYCPTQGDWLLPNNRFPEGLKKAAESIMQSGYVPGIWISPFMVGSESHITKKHPDWLLRNKDDVLITEWYRFGETCVWGQYDHEYYVLDTSHPDALNYLRNVFSTLYSWGYRLYKTDFMFWAMKNSKDLRRYTPGKTSVEYFREVLSIIRESIGEESYWIGCIAPFMPFLGYADAMRIGGDVGESWDSADGKGPQNMIQQIVGEQYFHTIFWQNDPDVVMLREKHINLEPNEIEALALYQAMSGGTIATSDPIYEVSTQRRALMDFIKPHGIHHGVVINFEIEDKIKMLLQNTIQGKLIYLFNTSDVEQYRKIDFLNLLGDTYYIREYHGQNIGKNPNYLAKIEKHSGLLLFASKTPLSKEPQNLWNW